MHEASAGQDQLFVTYVSEDSSGGVPAEWFVQEVVARDAGRRAADGWDIVSASVLPVRQVGTAGNVFFQSGGQYATQLAAVVLYRRR
jgi:hypothetical protein